MDKFITSEATHGLNPRSKFFEPLNPTRKAPETLAFHLIISDPSSDSSLTPNWTMPDTLLHVPAHVPLSGFFSHLREQLPASTTNPRRSYTRAATPSTPSSSSASSTNKVPLARRPKLGSAKLYLVDGRRGLVLPMVENDEEWDFRHGYAKVDLMDKTEAEWRLFKELLMAAGEEFRCYVAVAPARSREFPWKVGWLARKG